MSIDTLKVAIQSFQCNTCLVAVGTLSQIIPLIYNTIIGTELLVCTLSSPRSFRIIIPPPHPHTKEKKKLCLS